MLDKPLSELELLDKALATVIAGRRATKWAYAHAHRQSGTYLALFEDSQSTLEAK